MGAQQASCSYEGESAEIQGPPRELGEQLTEHLRGLRAKALRLERGASDAEDLVQDTIERALRSWNRFTPGSNLRSWLHTIMHNLFVDRCRVRNRREPAELLGETVVPGPDEREIEPWDQVSLVDLQALSQGLQRALLETVELVFFGGLSYAEAAERLHIPRTTVGTRLLRARRQLRRMLAEQLPGTAWATGAPRPRRAELPPARVLGPSRARGAGRGGHRPGDGSGVQSTTTSDRTATAGLRAGV